MNRRSFLGALAGLAASAAFDPERLLWVPGQRKIFIPPARPFSLRYCAHYDVIRDQWIHRILLADHGLLDPGPSRNSMLFSRASAAEAEAQMRKLLPSDTFSRPVSELIQEVIGEAEARRSLAVGIHWLSDVRLTGPARPIELLDLKFAPVAQMFICPRVGGVEA